MAKSSTADSILLQECCSSKCPSGEPAARSKLKTPSVSVFRLFRFATPKERAMICTAMLFSAGTGALQPVSILVYASFISSLTASLSENNSNLVSATLPVIHTMVYMGTASLVAAYVSTCLWILTGESQTRRIRLLYLKSVLHQDMSWFDQSKDGSLNTRLASDTQLIQDGISEKAGLLISFFAQFVGGFVVAFVKGWQMALVLLVAVPLLGVSGSMMAHFLSRYAKESQDSFAESGAIAEQAFQYIKTVYSFTLQRRFSDRYNQKLEDACKAGVKGGIALGVGFAFFMFFLFGTFGLALWFGSKLVTEGKLTGPSVFVVFLSMMLGCMSFVKLPPNLSAVSGACGAAYQVFKVIDRAPQINIDSEDGQTLATVQGTITFDHVSFSYPMRPDLYTIKDLTLQVNSGTTVAFVGLSGSGKSTAIQLMQRFYDVSTGQISLDGHNLKELNVKWLRQQIGVVNQEPILFNMTIRQNISMGCDNDQLVTDQEIIEACKEANCHSFISQLPNGYDTVVGDGGSMLSGGQRQRIAIARAIIRNPAILLLDEATSALDTQSERLVQNALDKVSSNRTTIIVAHRLSTIMNADLIVVLDRGSIAEKGTHCQLIELGGIYSDLVKKQTVHANTSKRDTQSLLPQSQAIELKDLDERHVSAELLDMKSHHHELALTKQKHTLKGQRAPVWRVFWHMRPEWSYLALGVVGSALAGCVFPLYAYSFSHVISILSVPGQAIQPSPLGGTNLYAFIFAIIGIAAFIGNGCQFMAFEICGQKYSKRLRGEVFAAYMKQEVAFFDAEENSVGALTTRLAVDTRSVNEMITKVWGDVTNLCITIVVALVIAFLHSWALTLVTLCMSPFLVASTAYEFYLQRGFEDSTRIANAQSSEIAGEAIRQVRTVAALNKQRYFEDRYFEATAYPHKLATRKAYLSSIGAACNKGVGIYTNAIAFYAGVHFIQHGMIDFQQMFTSMTVIMTASEAVGRSTTFVAAFAKAKSAASASFEILDRRTHIDPELEGIEPVSQSVRGNVEFRNIEFAYPARPDAPVFNGKFSLHGKSGQSIALVGPSGCGKSTTIGILQRWYDPSSGACCLDEHNVKSYSLYNLRSHISIVSQEPVLFDLSIEDNLRFGVDDNESVTQEQIQDACRSANIHDFIAGLPDGYNTVAGTKGSQLSGGQKQRIAIARALIRNPKVLLLDEATSALDSDSEKIVQQALDSVLKQGGRTTIMVAHRLSTIQNANLICVVNNGIVVEQGTHDELLALNREYASLVREQSLAVL
ncbi:P-loop containing nucleoside triphosphate hydrolase protein [Parasitella parasitica]|nr:P-loop containing nucleoside triphosphate hydrolase protein [Parasitella parasitica]